MRPSSTLATLFVASLPFFSNGCAVLELLIGWLTLLAYGPTPSGPYIPNDCPSPVICTTPSCIWAGQNGSFENGPIIEGAGLDPIRPTVWRPGDRALRAVNQSCQGLYGLRLHNGEDQTLQQAYQIIDLDDLFSPGLADRPERLRIGASFRITSSNTPPRTFKLTVFTFAGLDPHSFPAGGDAYALAGQALSVETTSVTRTRAQGAFWFPIQTVQTVPPEVNVLLVLLEYEFVGDLTGYDLYVDDVRIVFDDGPYGPLTANDAATTLLDQPVTLNVLANDIDPDGRLDPASLRLVASPTHGDVTLHDDGSLTYAPDAGFLGDDAFSYTVTDEDGLTAGALVTISVRPANRPPVAVADAVTVPAGTTTVLDILANDFDPDGDAITVFALGNPPNGTAEITDGGRAVQYTPDAGFTGSDVFAYLIVDAMGATSNEVEVALTVQ